MEGPGHQSVFTSSPFDGNAYNYLYQSAENYPYFEAEGGNESCYIPTPLPQWIHSQPMPHNYVQFLAENRPSEIQGETSYTNSCITSSFNPADSFIDIHEQKAEESKEGSPCSRVAFAKSVPLLKARSRVSRERASASDRRRRLKIAERLDALQELLPSTKKGGKASVLNDVIDHIKYLQLQIKDLSKSRLGGESTSFPFVFLEGYGHYLFHDEMHKEPLEEILGKLMEVNPTAATQLLGSRGLFVMPIALEKGLQV